MARVKSMGVRNYVGKLGGAVYYMNKGQNIGRELAPEISNPRTTAQMRQRMQWANLVNTYKLNKVWMGHLSFENKKQTWSDYNAFMSANLQATPVYITKQQAEAGAAILAPYIVTKGSIPVVSYSVRQGASFNGIVTGIKTDGSTITTLADLSNAIINSGTDWRNGDQFSIIVEEDFNMDGSLIRVWPIEIILDVNDTTPLSQIDTLWDMSLADIFELQTVGQDQYLAISLSDVPRQNNWAAAVVHSRTIEGRTSVSTQEFVLSNAQLAIYQQYISTAAFEAAAESYGQSTRYFLDARTDAQTVGEDVIASMFGTYQKSGNVSTFILVRGGVNTFMQGDSETSTSIILTTSVPLDDDKYTLAFFEEGTSVANSAIPNNRIAPNTIVFEFEYVNAGNIVDQAGTFKLYHGESAQGDPIDEFPVTV